MIKIVPSILFLLSLTSLILNVSLVTSDTVDIMQLCSAKFFDLNSSYKDNLNTLLSTLSLNSNQSNNNGYYATNTSSLGSRSINSEIIYGLYICEGDISSKECNECVSVATQNISKVDCPFDKSAVIWYNKCMVRYSNVSFLGIVDESVSLPYRNLEDVSTDAQAYMEKAGEVLQSLAAQVSNPTSAMTGDKRYFGTQVAQVKDSIISVYTMVQCTPDLAPLDCQKCLQIITNDSPTKCGRSKGCRMLNPSCNLRYEQYGFSELPMAPPPSASPSSLAPLKAPAIPSSIGNFSTLPTGKRGTGTSRESLVLKIALGHLVLVLVILVVVFIVLLIMKGRRSTNAASSGNIIMLGMNASQRPNFDNGYVTSVDSLEYDLATLEVATNNFSDDNKIGEGGFGSVYKGTLQNGVEIAVKRLSKGSKQGLEQFKNEVLLVAKHQHRNLVKLMGFCLTSNEMLLVYEFACNKSLDLILFDSNRRRRLGWPARNKIINGIARGLSYLHEDSRRRIIHRDLKASNTLLDANMNPKISDFGLARFFSENQDQEHTERLAGTIGYMAPEYIDYGEISTKSDVYSFSILVLEIISGKKIGNRHAGVVKNLLTFAWKHWNEDTIGRFVDECMEDAYNSEEVKRCIHLGLLCVQSETEKRPSMIKVVTYLNSNVDLPAPQQPTFVSSIVGFSPGASELQSDPDWSHKSKASTRSMSQTNLSTGISSQSFPGLEET
ncbi:cysteine-rich receptor-like protein kinase 25 [Silene latifolia]|uniref:cysteine-rich receptor-like protein kinase 25 n=1 Tax=Silene latifolia TaxID=37657 RepID=UPI003D77D66B